MGKDQHALKQLLQSYQRSGVEFLPRATMADNLQERQDESSEVASNLTTLPAKSSDEKDEELEIREPASESANGKSKDERISELAILQSEVANCTLCDELAATRTQTVFGVGNVQPRLVFLGEAPGADEDREGEPFVGKAGRKLTDIIEKGMGISRQDVYILNILKCRPPGNRDPSDNEAYNCRHFLDRQLSILNPKFICCLGRIAAKNLLKTESSVGKLRGTFHDYKGITVMVTYHPAYLLRQDSARAKVWEDIKMLMGEMGLKVGKS